MTTSMMGHLNTEEVIKSFPAYDGPGCPDCITDFLGVRTRTSYIIGLDKKSGEVEGYPIPTNFHASAIEWAGVLQSVLEARKLIVAVELGAGWAPWLVTVARAARLRGIDQFRLVGVEGCTTHCQFMASHFSDNGLNPKDHTFLYGVVGIKDGEAKFPVVADPTAGYGARARLEGLTETNITNGDHQKPMLSRLTRKVLQTFARRGPAIQNGGQPEADLKPTRVVKSYSLPTILMPFLKVDLVHVDIQGDEYEVLKSARQVLKEKVMRLVIGTHGRSIEQQLLEHLAAEDWCLESEEACIFSQHVREMVLVRDGTQVWRNPAFG